jgi:hypothetical protein
VVLTYETKRSKLDRRYKSRSYGLLKQVCQMSQISYRKKNIIYFFTERAFFNKEVGRTEPSRSVRIPCPNIRDVCSGFRKSEAFME